MADEIRVGLIGANYGAKHAKAFAGLEQIAVVAIADPDESRRAALAAELEIERQHESAEEMMGAGGLDAVVVSSPTYLHERHIGQAFDTGLHVLCDSPVGANGREVSHVITSAGLVGKVFMWSNPLRFDPRISKARELLDSGELGDVFQGSARIQKPDWPHEPHSWRLDRERGGGALLEVGTQALDALWFAMGCPDPMEAMAARYELFSKEHAAGFDSIAEDSLMGMVRFKTGACLQFSAQIKAPMAEDSPERSFSIWTANGCLDLHRGTLHSVGAASQPRHYAQATDEAACLEAQAAEFVRAIREKDEPLSPGKDALALSKMLDALATSSHEKEATSIKVERSLEDLFGGL